MDSSDFDKGSMTHSINDNDRTMSMNSLHSDARAKLLFMKESLVVQDDYMNDIPLQLIVEMNKKKAKKT
jgi:hypothetical protein